MNVELMMGELQSLIEQVPQVAESGWSDAVSSDQADARSSYRYHRVGSQGNAGSGTAGKIEKETLDCDF